MEIHALKVTITEQDLNDLAREHAPDDQPVENLRVIITEEGIAITGEYPLFVAVAFETIWEPRVEAGQVAVRLVKFKAMGMPVTAFRNFVLSMVASMGKKEDWIRLDDEVILIDPDRMLARQKLPVRTNLKTLTLLPGLLIVEAGE